MKNMRDDREVEWNQVPLEFIDLTHEDRKQDRGDWTVGIEFKREPGAKRPRVRSFAMNDETGEFYTLEAPKSPDDKPKLSDEEFFAKVPEEVAILAENIATSTDLGVMLGLGLEKEILQEQEEYELAETTEPRFLLDEPETDEPRLLTEETVEAEIADADLDDELRELVMEDLQQSWRETVDSHSRQADRFLDRLIAYQQESVRDIVRKRDYAAEAEETNISHFRQAEASRRNQGHGPGLGA